jgi:hypothetical protein
MEIPRVGRGSERRTGPFCGGVSLGTVKREAKTLTKRKSERQIETETSQKTPPVRGFFQL